MSMREQFEAWYRNEECLNAEQAALVLQREPCGGYTYRDPQSAWKIRQAARSTTCPGHGRSECVSCCWPKGGQVVPALQMAHVVRALEKVRGAPVLTSNQCYDLARALNGIQRDQVQS